ncbi:TPA: sigma-70 family RNA polymerase sigma factor [Clostridium botulinum]|uniref:sigma-70 family RNA polymerase sigma factor n=1 Tax=Clostridium botulinum TaxID=1491 RepID=UPI000D0CDFBC|nr:sigma-70 family RNA polymerase sigma factor [Clostridium botulinum]PSL96334.1 siderophore-interacting protein [Clostridium botulinum]HDK7140056.1 sigma-70 family RNA polymerase sigma factor [Clostridium botulinum]HDK7143644.1 sigma-70 family RNA polymerase sigma factor [Clostridium botulinum]HDK7147290.1 sigma-70 family RNA polymerase sigma factor [Clostridium botulinum]HDK7151032.1 sigma-70 family RNA polymerase sigma factor [Clostridium botulinum]
MTNEQLIYLYQQGDRQALDKVIEQNKGIVYKLANKFYVEGTNSIDKEDLEQEGFIGLIVAAERYDFNNPNKAKFITYAIHWIYHKINRFINQKNTNGEISVYTPINEDDTTLLDTLEDDKNSYENIENKIYYEELRKELNEVINEYITLREREVLKLHYGWDNSQPMTLQEIGEVFNVASSGITKIKSKAIRKIRSSPWGRKRINEKYKENLSSLEYNVESWIQADSFEKKFKDWLA